MNQDTQNSFCPFICYLHVFPDALLKLILTIFCCLWKRKRESGGHLVSSRRATEVVHNLPSGVTEKTLVRRPQPDGGRPGEVTCPCSASSSKTEEFFIKRWYNKMGLVDDQQTNTFSNSVRRLFLKYMFLKRHL